MKFIEKKIKEFEKRFCEKVFEINGRVYHGLAIKNQASFAITDWIKKTMVGVAIKSYKKGLGRGYTDCSCYSGIYKGKNMEKYCKLKLKRLDLKNDNTKRNR